MINHEKLCQNKKILIVTNKNKILILIVFEILPMNFHFVSPFCFFSVYKDCPKVIFFY